MLIPVLSLGWSYTCPPKFVPKLASCICWYCLRAREMHQASLETSAFALGCGPPNIPLLLTSPVGHSPSPQEGCWGWPSPRHICSTGCVARLRSAGAWGQVPSIRTLKGQAGCYVSGAGHSGMEELPCRSCCGLPMPRACTEGSWVMSRAGSPGSPCMGAWHSWHCAGVVRQPVSQFVGPQPSWNADQNWVWTSLNGIEQFTYGDWK